jgi:hypothetical protein
MKAKRKPAAKAKRRQNDNDPHAEFHRKLGVAFRHQESAILDLMTMATITAELGDHDQQSFAVYQLHDLIEKFKEQWYADIEKARFKPAA